MQILERYVQTDRKSPKMTLKVIRFVRGIDRELGDIFTEMAHGVKARCSEVTQICATNIQTLWIWKVWCCETPLQRFIDGRFLHWRRWRRMLWNCVKELGCVVRRKYKSSE